MSINGMSHMDHGIMLNICHVKIQRPAEEVIILKASIRYLSSRFPNQHITSGSRRMRDVGFRK